MYRAFIFALTLALGLFPALAQSPIRAFPPGVFQSRAAIDGAPVPGSPMTSVIFSDTQTAPSTGSTSFLGINGGATTTGVNSRDVPTPIAGTIGNLSVSFPTATGAAKTYVITLLKNGSAAGSPGNVSCTIDNTHTTCTDTTDTASVSAGDLLSWQIVPSGTPAAQTAGAYTISSTLVSSVNGQSAIFGATSGTSPSTTVANYSALGGGSIVWNATEINVSALVAASGTIDGLYLKVSTAPAATSTFTVFKNGVAQALTCNIITPATTCNDPIGGGHAFSVSPTDTISIESCPGVYSAGSCAPAGTPADGSVKYSVGWIPTTSGQQIVSATSLGVNASAARFFNLISPGVVTGSVATEATTAALAPVALTWKSLYVKTDAALSGTQTRVNVNRKGTGAGQSDGTITCTLNSTNTTACNDTTHTYSASAGDLLNWSTTPTNTPPANAYYKFGTIITVP